jgi:hypothetical protein
MLKLRIIGFPEEIERSLETLSEVFEILEASKSYPCRPPNSEKLRVYLEVNLSKRPVTRVVKERQ